MKTSQTMSWEEQQKALDRESSQIMRDFERQQLEEKVERLSPERYAIHQKYDHDPKRCRCFLIEGII